MQDVDGSARMGRILELADALAADVGYRHALPDGYREGCGVSVATASIDSLMINGREFSGTHDIWLTAYVTLVGRSSMEVRTSDDRELPAPRADGPNAWPDIGTTAPPVAYPRALAFRAQTSAPSRPGTSERPGQREACGGMIPPLRARSSRDA